MIDFDYTDEGDSKELWHEMVGALLGEGQFRRVFVMKYAPEYVIKVEQRPKCFHNIKEWTHWKDLEDSDIAQWFAPCVGISGQGRYLIQKRTTIVTERDMPAKMPRCLTDRKFQNFGMLEGRVVCHDYGNIIADYSGRMVKGDFWDANQYTT